MNLKNDIRNFKNKHRDKLHKHRNKIKWLSVILIFVFAVITVQDVLNLLFSPNIDTLFKAVHSVPILLYFITRMFPHAHTSVEKLNTTKNRKILLIVALVGAIMSIQALSIVFIGIFLYLEYKGNGNRGRKTTRRKKTGSDYRYEPNNNSSGKFKFD
jgi:type IV secretory pathway component VirB8